MDKAQPTLLEPVDEVSVLVPDDYVGAVMSDLSGRRGRVLGTEPIGVGRTLVKAEIPELEITRYAIDLRSVSHGTGSFTRAYLRHEPLPSHLASKVAADSQARLHDVPVSAPPMPRGGAGGAARHFPLRCPGVGPVSAVLQPAQWNIDPVGLPARCSIEPVAARPRSASCVPGVTCGSGVPCRDWWRGGAWPGRVAGGAVGAGAPGGVIGSWRAGALA